MGSRVRSVEASVRTVRARFVVEPFFFPVVFFVTSSCCSYPQPKEQSNRQQKKGNKTVKKSLRKTSARKQVLRRVDDVLFPENSPLTELVFFLFVSFFVDYPL